MNVCCEISINVGLPVGQQSLDSSCDILGLKERIQKSQEERERREEHLFQSQQTGWFTINTEPKPEEGSGAGQLRLHDVSFTLRVSFFRNGGGGDGLLC